MTDSDITKVRDYAESKFQCSDHSIHGPCHWRNVEDSVLLIAPRVGADLVVCRLFAILHDCCRLNDGSDRQHGPRAAAHIRQLAGTLITLEQERLELLCHAVHGHTEGRITGCSTIGTCWDADRLDLGRAGIIPKSKFMSTTPGKQIAELGSRYLYIEKYGGDA